MRIPFSQTTLKFLALFSIGLAVLVLIGVGISQYFRHRHQEAYKIGVIINSVEITQEDLAVVKFIIGKKVHELNMDGTIDGKSLDIFYLDDKGSAEQLQKLVKVAVKDPNLIGFVGCRSSLRATAIAPLLGRKKIPFIGGFSLTSVNAPYPNIYSMDVSMKEVSVVLQNLLEQKASRAAYLGQAGDLYSEALLKIMTDLQKRSAGFKVVFQQPFPREKQFSATEIKMLATELKESKADLLLISANQQITNHLLEGLWQEGVKIPVYTGLADMAQIRQNMQGYEAAELFDVGLLGIPGALNARLQERLDLYKDEVEPSENLAFQVGYGGRHADAIGLLWETAQPRKGTQNLPVRERINQGLLPFINGNQVYRGWFTNWYFTPDRTFAGEELLAWKPPGSFEIMLAPFQNLREDDKLAPASVVYASLDMVQIGQEDDEAGTFDASFYLEMTSSNDIDITQLDFANAARNSLNHEPLIEAKLIKHQMQKLDRKFFTYLYRVSGKFLFDPDLKPYPFDEQKFPVTIQTGQSTLKFMVQPAGEKLRDVDFDSPGWNYLHNYVGYDQDIITTDTTFSSFQKNIPLYKFSFVYVLKRARIDFTLKTLTPLLAILIISYFSVYIPAREFEAMAGIQVTALLAAIALYFSIAKPEMPYATISDKIFIFSYLMITSLIGTSILIYVMYRRSNRLKQLARIYQRLVFPVIVIGFTLLIRS